MRIILRMRIDMNARPHRLYDMESPKTIIERLTGSGMTEEQIAEALRKSGVEVSQATINRIKTGKHRKTSFEIGMGLLRLHKRRTGREQVA